MDDSSEVESTVALALARAGRAAAPETRLADGETWVIEPNAGLYAVAPDVVTETVRNGIVIPDVAQEAPQVGVIRAVGADSGRYGVGDVVVYGRYTGSEVTIGSQELLLIREIDILGRLRRLLPAGDVSLSDTRTDAIG